MARKFAVCAEAPILLPCLQFPAPCSLS